MTDPLIVDCYEGDLNGHPDWQKLADAGPPWHGAIVKASEGLAYHSSWFGMQWRALKTVGGARYGQDWFRGAYHYARIAEDAVKQAHVYLGQVEQAGGWDVGDLWPMIDVESANNPDKPGKAKLEDWVSTYAAEIERETGRKPTLYGNIYLWENGVTSTCGCGTLIVARYSMTLPATVYQRIGWTWSAKPDAEPPTLLGWQGVGDGEGYWSMPTTSPIGKVDITAFVVANGGTAALEWVRQQLAKP
jgi:GH25 family lysozyme M1 (1,4-beta-N-acetylmuramidase)